jgi:hypothetical protein
MVVRVIAVLENVSAIASAAFRAVSLFERVTGGFARLLNHRLWRFDALRVHWFRQASGLALMGGKVRVQAKRMAVRKGTVRGGLARAVKICGTHFSGGPDMLTDPFLLDPFLPPFSQCSPFNVIGVTRRGA